MNSSCSSENDNESFFEDDDEDFFEFEITEDNQEETQENQTEVAINVNLFKNYEVIEEVEPQPLDLTSTEELQIKVSRRQSIALTSYPDTPKPVKTPKIWMMVLLYCLVLALTIISLITLSQWRLKEFVMDGYQTRSGLFSYVSLKSLSEWGLKQLAFSDKQTTPGFFSKNINAII